MGAWSPENLGGEWLEPEEVNVGYNVFPQYRRRGYLPARASSPHRPAGPMYT